MTIEFGNRRYISLNVHFQSGFRSLGLIRIQGSMNAAQAIRPMLVDERLKCFGLDLDKDVVATVTDGASIAATTGRRGRRLPPWNLSRVN